MAKPTMPTDPFEVLPFMMVQAHETFKRGCDKIEKVLADPPMHDLSNFLGYCGTWVESLSDHHHTEELIVFPFLNKKMDFAEELEAHEAIHAMLDELILAIKEAQADQSKFKPAEILEILMRGKENLYAHLDAEVSHIQPKNLRDAGIDGKELQETLEKLNKHAVSTANPWTMVPYMRSHTAPEYKDIFPPMPWLVRKVIIPYVFAQRYSGYWKYSPYSVS